MLAFVIGISLPKYKLQYARISPPVALNRYLYAYLSLSILSRSVECCEIARRTGPALYNTNPIRLKVAPIIKAEFQNL